MKKIIVVLIVAALALPLAATAQRSRCTPARLRAAGRLMFCRVKAYAAGISRTQSPNADLDACDATFLAKWQALTDAYGDCPAVDEQGVLTAVRDCVDTVVNLIVGRPKVIFASSQLMEPGYPSYVYPEGADARCQTLANAVPALTGRSFKAFICGSSPDVANGDALGIRDRFTASLGGYVDPLGTLIADSLDDLLDGTIQNPIVVDETGTPIVIGGGREYAWTGCQANGGSKTAEYRCQLGSYSWTTGHVGTTGGKGHLLSTTGGLFIDAELEACSAPLHLICVEQ